MKDFLFGTFLIFPLLLLNKSAFYNIKEHTLKNGMKLLVLEDHSSPIISLGLWFKVGSRNEVTGKTGISHLLEHMMFKGTEKVGSEEFSKIIQRMGGTDNAFTGNDMTAYYEVFPAENLKRILELESDRLQNLVFREFESEKNVVMEERRWRTENLPDGVFWEELYALAYRAHPYKNPVVGWMSDIEGITLEDVKKHYKTYYSPNNTVMVIVGDVKEKEALELVKKYFEKIPPAKEIPEVNTKEPPQLGERRAVIKKEGFSKKIAIAYHIPEAGHPDEIPVSILAYVLGGDKSSRLYKKLVREKELVTNVFAYADIRVDPGLFLIMADLKLQTPFEEVEKEIISELEKVKQEGVTNKELLKGKNQTKASFVYYQQSTMYQNFIIGSFEIERGWKKLLTWMDDINKVENDDIKRVANNYFKEDNRTVLYLEPVPPQNQAEYFKKMMESMKKEFRR